MNKIFEMIKKTDKFKYVFFNVLQIISILMILSALLCMFIYCLNYNYELLLSAKELLLGSLGVFSINCSTFYILCEINDIFKKN